MTVLKWVLIVLGALLLLVIAIVALGLYWASTVEPVKLTAADLEIGGAYPTEERQALDNSCRKTVGASSSNQDACTCIADKAGTELSRFERLVLAAGFEASPTKIVAVTRGLIESGIPEEKVHQMEDDSQERIDALMGSCGLKK